MLAGFITTDIWERDSMAYPKIYLVLNDSTVPLILHCPHCNHRHIDEGAFELRLHHTHACQNCGLVWRPAVHYTHGVQFLPGFKD